MRRYWVLPLLIACAMCTMAVTARLAEQLDAIEDAALMQR
jgi:hypothetical protein